MLTLLLIVFAEHHENTHKTKTLTINEDNERLQLCYTIFLSIIKKPLPQANLRFFLQVHGDNQIRIGSDHF